MNDRKQRARDVLLTYIPKMAIDWAVDALDVAGLLGPTEGAG